MPLNDTLKTTARKMDRSATIKLFTISFLILLLLIPASMVKSIIHERESRKANVIGEINHKWGHQQTIVGPVISIPYMLVHTGANHKRTTVTRYLHLLPDAVTIDTEIKPQVRYRGIYEAVLYNARVVIVGRFPKAPIKQMRIAPDNIIWSGATLSLGIADMRGIKERIKADLNGAALTMDPGITTTDVITSGVHAGIALDSEKAVNHFRVELNLNGSEQIHFAPVGKVTTVTARSKWKDPSFVGAFLPAERTIDANGFSALWRVLHLNRSYPQYWTEGDHDLTASTFGVKLFRPVDIYQKSMRTAKYALMFIVLTFMAFFISEVIHKLRVHPVQYLLIGLAMIIFYTLLISISEHIGFGGAYLISAIAVMVLIGGYTNSILKNRPVTCTVSALLMVLFGFLYVLLQLEDYALVMGSIGLFTALAVTMHVTRHIDWYGIGKEGKPSTREFLI